MSRSIFTFSIRQLFLSAPLSLTTLNLSASLNAKSTSPFQVPCSYDVKRRPMPRPIIAETKISIPIGNPTIHWRKFIKK